MIDLLRDRHESIADVCRTFHVRRLEVFGSAATGMFDAARSDVDFIVEFGEDSGQPGLLLRYLALAERLEQVVGCRVDLLTNRSIRNPYFRETVDRSREMIYDDSVDDAIIWDAVSRHVPPLMTWLQTALSDSRND